MRLVAADSPPALPLATPVSTPGDQGASSLLQAATTLLASLELGAPLDARTLRAAMTEAFGGSDGEGAWVWKDAYDACEAAQVLFLRRHLGAMRRRAGTTLRLLDMIGKVAALMPTHTRRTEDSLQFQQFSTPPELGFAASIAAAIAPVDVVLEPSAGTGLLAIYAEFERRAPRGQ